MASRKRNRTARQQAREERIRNFSPRVVLRAHPDGTFKIDTNMADTEEAWKLVFRMLSVAGGQVANRLGQFVNDGQVEVARSVLVGPDGNPL